MVRYSDFTYQILESSYEVEESALDDFACYSLFHNPFWVKRGFLIACRPLDRDSYTVYWRGSGDEVWRFVREPLENVSSFTVSATDIFEGIEGWSAALRPQRVGLGW